MAEWGWLRGSCGRGKRDVEKRRKKKKREGREGKKEKGKVSIIRFRVLKPKYIMFGKISKIYVFDVFESYFI